MSHAAPSFADAPPGRYSMSAGTVTDSRTGLTWQKDVDASLYTWASAKTYCQGLALNGNGWRLPALKELLTLVDPTRAEPNASIDPTAFPNTPLEQFWTASPRVNLPQAWYVHFKNGFSAATATSTSYRVRCVR